MLKKFRKTIPDSKFIKSFLKVALPMILSEMLMISVGFIDNFMIGHYGNHNNSLSSLLIANEILFVSMGIPMFFMNGFTMFIAQFHGAKDEEKLRQSVKFWQMTSLMFGLVLASVVLSATPQLVEAFGPKNLEIKQGAIDYIRYAMPAAIMMIFGFIAMTSAAITGRPFWPLILGVGTVVINVVGDYLLIYTADMGIIGSAIATDISRVYELTLAIIVYLKYHDINIFINFFHVDWTLYRKEFKKLTTAISQLAFTLSLVTISAVMSRGYPEAQAAMSAGYAIAGILWSSFGGVGGSVKVFVGRELGKNKFDQAEINARKIGWSILAIVIPLSAISLTLAFFLPQAMGVEKDSIELARNMVLIYAGAIWLYIYSSLFFGVLNAGGHVRASNIIQNYFQLAFVIPIACLFIWGLNTDFTISFLATQVSQVIPFIVSITLFERMKWKNNLTHNKKQLSI